MSVVLAAAAALITLVATGERDDVAVPVALAAVAGLVIGLVAAWIVDSIDSTIRDTHDLAKLTGVPNLAVVARHPIGAARPDDVTMFRDPNSIEAEGYRTLRTSLEFVTRSTVADVGEPADVGEHGDGAGDEADEHPSGPIVLVTSPRPGEGKSSVAANLAAAAAMAGRRVVLVDGDLRKPQVHRLFRARNESGLSSILKGDAIVAEAVQRLDGVKGLALLSAGPPPPDPAELLVNERLGLTLRALARAADLVVVDAPPLLAVTDPTVIVQHCDAVLMVATAGLSSRGEWAEAMPRLALVDANVVGTVLLQPDDRVQATPTYRYTPSAAPTNWWVTRAAATESSNGASDHGTVSGGAATSGVDTSGGDTADELPWQDDPTSPEERPASHAWVVDVPTNPPPVDEPIRAGRPDDHRRLADPPYRRLNATTAHAASSETGAATATATTAGAVVGSIPPVRATATAAIPPISPIVRRTGNRSGPNSKANSATSTSGQNANQAPTTADPRPVAP